MATFLSYAFILFFLCLSVVSSTVAQSGGFSVELIHRDSPESPFYNPNETSYQRLRNALSRSVNRVKHFNKSLTSSKAAQADIIPNDIEYLIRISIGTPPVEILAVADTGSDLIWTQCVPCPKKQCYKQYAPLFDPRKSTTYKSISCSSRQCSSLDKKSCSKGNCKYFVSYGDKSFSDGYLATETATLGSTTGHAVAFPGTVFGCGTNNGGKFTPKTEGVVGLGLGHLSLVSQLGTSIAGKFSYCLVLERSTKINFGTNGVVSGPGVVTTPLIVKSETFYILTLEAISVGNLRLGISTGSTPGMGIIIDSGTTYSMLPKVINSKLMSIISSKIAAQPVAIPEFDLCYRISSVSQVPAITVHFRGADVKLNTFNYFAEVSKGIMCSVFQGSNGDAIYGNVMQNNFLIGYDIEKRKVSFKPTDCTKH